MPKPRHDDEPTTETRREWAHAALVGYLDAKHAAPDTVEADVTDLVTDLLHLLDEYDIEIDTVLHMARHHHDEEA